MKKHFDNLGTCCVLLSQVVNSKINDKVVWRPSICVRAFVVNAVSSWNLIIYRYKSKSLTSFAVYQWHWNSSTAATSRKCIWRPSVPFYLRHCKALQPKGNEVEWSFSFRLKPERPELHRKSLDATMLIGTTWVERKYELEVASSHECLLQTVWVAVLCEWLPKIFTLTDGASSRCDKKLLLSNWSVNISFTLKFANSERKFCNIFNALCSRFRGETLITINSIFSCSKAKRHLIKCLNYLISSRGFFTFRSGRNNFWRFFFFRP